MSVEVDWVACIASGQYTWWHHVLAVCVLPVQPAPVNVGRGWWMFTLPVMWGEVAYKQSATLGHCRGPSPTDRMVVIAACNFRLAWLYLYTRYCILYFVCMPPTTFTWPSGVTIEVLIRQCYSKHIGCVGQWVAGCSWISTNWYRLNGCKMVVPCHICYINLAAGITKISKQNY